MVPSLTTCAKKVTTDSHSLPTFYFLLSTGLDTSVILFQSREAMLTHSEARHNPQGAPMVSKFTVMRLSLLSKGRRLWPETVYAS